MGKGAGRHGSVQYVGSSTNLTDLADLMEGGDLHLGEFVKVLVALDGVRASIDFGPAEVFVKAVEVEDVDELLRLRLVGSCTRCMCPKSVTFLGSFDSFDNAGLTNFNQSDRSSSSSFSSWGLS